jgi:hypothetical protein
MRLAREDVMPAWVKWLIAALGVALVAAILIANGVVDPGEGVGGILGVVGAMELVLPIAHALGRLLFDHSNERALDRLRESVEGGTEDGEDDREERRGESGNAFDREAVADGFGSYLADSASSAAI